MPSIPLSDQFLVLLTLMLCHYSATNTFLQLSMCADNKPAHQVPSSLPTLLLPSPSLRCSSRSAGKGRTCDQWGASCYVEVLLKRCACAVLLIITCDVHRLQCSCTKTVSIVQGWLLYLW